MTTMLSARTRFIALAVATALSGTALAAGQSGVVGINAVVVNSVRERSAGAPQAHDALVKQRVALGDEVQTGGRSQLQVLLLDKSLFNVGANARLTIDRFVYDPARGGRAVAATVVKGAFRFISGRPDAAGSSITTPVATIGIRGTIVEGVVGEEAIGIAEDEPALGRMRADPASATLVVLRGPGRRTQGKVRPGAIDVTAAGLTVRTDEPMRAIYVPGPGATPIGPFTLSPEGLRQLQSLLFPALASALGPASQGSGGGTGWTPTERPMPDYPVAPRGYPSDNGGGQTGSRRGPLYPVPQFPSGQVQQEPTPNGARVRGNDQPAPSPSPSPSPRPSGKP